MSKLLALLAGIAKSGARALAAHACDLAAVIYRHLPPELGAPQAHRPYAAIRLPTLYVQVRWVDVYDQRDRLRMCTLSLGGDLRFARTILVDDLAYGGGIERQVERDLFSDMADYLHKEWEQRSPGDDWRNLAPGYATKAAYLSFHLQPLEEQRPPGIDRRKLPASPRPAGPKGYSPPPPPPPPPPKR